MTGITVSPRTVSLEDALRNLASTLTGKPVAQLPRTTEAIVQYMAEHIPTPAERKAELESLAEAITQEVVARIGTPTETAPVTASVTANEAPSSAVVPEPAPGSEAATAPTQAATAGSKQKASKATN